MVSTTARIAVVAGLLVLPLAALAPRFVSAVLALGLVVAAVALPALAPDSRGVVALHEQFPGIKESAIHRLLIWRFAADRIAERPLAGWGMDASRELPGGHTNLADLLPEADLAFDAVALPLHPHDALLQWEVELGLPGVALGLAVLVWPLWRIGWRWPAPPGAQGAALAGATAALAVALLSFGIWQAWWLSGLWLVAAQLAAIAQGPGNSVSMRPMTR
jgi:O-antigen ligase